MESTERDFRVRVASAVILRTGRILLTQRRPDKDYPWTWECPGGKVERHETLSEGLAREIREELGLEVPVQAPSQVDCLWNGSFEQGPPSAPRFDLFMIATHIGDQNPRPVEGQGMGWFTIEEFLSLPLAPGNEAARSFILLRMLREKGEALGYYDRPASEVIEGRQTLVEIIQGAEGACLALNSQRVAGRKPWAGGRILFTFKVALRDVLQAVAPRRRPASLAQGGRRLRTGRTGAPRTGGRRRGLHPARAP